MTSRTLLLLAALAACCARGRGGEPVFDPRTLMRLVLAPADAPVGAPLYRVRASDPDFDYPMQFELVGQMGRLDVSIETLPCTRYNSVCQANVILLRRLEPGRYVDFRVQVTNSRGRSNRIACSLTATNATTPRDTIFPHIPKLILVPENAKRGTDLEFVIARKNPIAPKPVDLELWGSPLFAIRQRLVSPENTEGTIFLLGPLDFETQSMYHLTLLAIDPYAEMDKDTRNIAGLEVVVVVQDVQDMPPVFTHAPPVTHLAKHLVPGDIVVRVRAEDGDKGAPRQIRYGLVSEGNPFTPFFNMNETTGEITLERPLADISAISHAGVPVLLTVVAEEVKLSRDEPEAMSTTVQLAFILPERENTPPYFENQFYITYLDENSPQGTALVFNDPYIPDVSDSDEGQNAVFSLTLVGNNGTFEISPTVAERHTTFLIKVRDNNYLDYEARKSVIFQIIAQELGPTTNLTTTVNVTVYLNDINDNPPFFLQNSYEVELAENVTAGARVVQVAAEDVDTGVFGKIQYTAILGYLNTSLHLDPMTGVITVATNNHGFDRESMPDLHFLVEARDDDGVGIRVTVPLIIKLLDVNDQVPQFERSLYEFVLLPNLSNFTSPAFIKAIDNDAEPPNNIVRYEIIHGNYEDKFALTKDTGELYLLKPLKRISAKTERRQKRQFESDDDSEVYILTARAYDLGVPRLHSTTMIKVYPPESKTRTMLFIVPGTNPDRIKTERILSSISGGKVTILEVRPYKGNEVGATDVTAGNASQGKSVVLATVMHTANSVIDVSHIQEQLSKNKTIITNTAVSSDNSDSSSSTVYKAENKLLFWLLIFLAIIIAIILLSLVFCCICEGCPLYMPPRKRVIRVNSTDDDVHLVVHEKGGGKESKSIHAAEWRKREAWSAEQADLRTKPTQWKFNRRNYRGREFSKPASTPGDLRSRDFVMPAAAAKDYKVGGSRRSLKLREGPNIIYTKEMQLQDSFANKHREYLEDMENDYDRIATLHYTRKNAKGEEDNDSIRRHEIERGSEVFLKSEASKQVEDTDNARYRPHANEHEFEDAQRAPSSQGREQYFIKEGNTEILRLVTRGKQDEDRYVNLPVHQPQRPVTLIQQPQYIVVDSGKDMLMQRFIREQGEEVRYMRDNMGNEVETTNIAHEKGLGIAVSQQSIVGGEIHNLNLVTTIPNVNEYVESQPEVPGTVPVKSDEIKSALREMQNKTSYQQELLETSLRKQNELLHQILLERERIQMQNTDTASQFESKLETQSLPGHSVMATQTDCHMSTQTEPHLLVSNRRKARSDNDSYSEEELEMVVDQDPRQIMWVRRKKPRKKTKYKEYNPRKSMKVHEVKRKIRTPILEESELSLSLESEKRVKVSKTNQREEHVKNYGDKKTSLLRTSKNEVVTSIEIKNADRGHSNSALKREVLMEISDSLDEQVEPSSSKHKRSKLHRQAPVTDAYNKESDENVESNTNLQNAECISPKTEEISKVKSSRQRMKDRRNQIFSRQGSSTDAKESSHNEAADLQQEEVDIESKSASRSEEQYNTSIEINETLEEVNISMPTKATETQPTKDRVSKPVEKMPTKSMPRYMQWYNNKKTSSSSAKPEKQEKIIPSKPKRITKPKTQREVADKSQTENEKPANYGKLMQKGKQENEKDAKKQTKSKGEEKDKKFIHPRILKEEQVKSLPEGPLPDVHPLLQHSEHRYEHQYQNANPLCYIQPTHLPQYLGMKPNVSVNSQPGSFAPQPVYVNQSDLNNAGSNVGINPSHLNSEEIQTNPSELNVQKIQITNGSSNIESKIRLHTKVEDNDSGIAMNPLKPSAIKRHPITEKKSVFTIAYDDVHSKQFRPDSSSTSY